MLFINVEASISYKLFENFAVLSVFDCTSSSDCYLVLSFSQIRLFVTCGLFINSKLPLLFRNPSLRQYFYFEPFINLEIPFLDFLIILG